MSLLKIAEMVSDDVKMNFMLKVKVLNTTQKNYVKIKM